MKARGMERQGGGNAPTEGAVPTEGGKRDRMSFSRGGETAPTTGAAPTSNSDRGGRSRGGK